MYESLKNRFKQLVQPYSAELVDVLWQECLDAYTEKKRFYHTLNHLENLFLELEKGKDIIEDWETISFSVFYHDIVYNVRKKDNEEKSAVLAVKRLKEIGYPLEKIKKCEAQIIATKSHSVSEDEDTNLFTDADLSILGKDWEVYKDYFKSIRKEYKIYPDLLYKPARKKALLHFLEMPFLFKTDFFREIYEKQAKRNIEGELKE